MLPRNPVLPPAQDYDALKAEMIAAVQRLCPEWTDFNAHDPGVTLIELLCFALTDLGYRVGLPIEALLGSSMEELARPALFSAPPVTVADFRRLLLDRVEGLGNVWLRPRGTTGLHDIRLQPELPLPGVHPETRPSYKQLIERTRRAWERHRPLCEDIGSIRLLEPKRTVIQACVRMERGAHPEAVLAQALFRIALTLAPEPRRSALEGVAPASGIEGPLMLNGMIATGQLGEKPAEIDTAALWERIADVPGVLGIDDLRLWVEGAGHCTRYAIGPDDYCSLDGAFEATALPIVVERGGQRCTVDRGEVLRQLMRLWAAHRNRGPLKSAHQQPFGKPKPGSRNLRAFAPLGPQLPRVYGLASGKPETAAARQLHGLLKLFEDAMLLFCEELGQVQGVGTGSGEQIAPRWLDMLLSIHGIAPPPAALPASRRTAAKRALLAASDAMGQRRGRGFDPEARAGSRRFAGPELRMRLMLGTGVRITLVEHNMLRPRREEHGTHASTGQRHGMTVSAVVSGGEADRAQITAMLRDEVPAHLRLRVHFLDGARWRHFHHVHRLWRTALRLDELRATDALAAQLRDMLEKMDA
ncbi:hypothetical protein LQ953_09145 [Sphingomonas sp. IC-56]|uniref:hypothetical protein n=1 Tax=Sphingomonas sp. IC-56 TaxID=2898529 RepID=UPI001E2D4809|nr:hypothetical protein [Sphingomonas sp. IC-56]MCD2324175.1 hypothetical protein [Sphingomonas sp. IC-56]